jgi:uncharacterized membrane protein YgcG
MRSRFALVAAFALIALFVALPGQARAQTSEEITSFDVTYDIDSEGSVHVTEDIRYDFGINQKHGIFRNTPVRYEYDDNNDRLIQASDVNVTNGTGDEWEFDITDRDPSLVIKIGDPDVFVTGEQRYVITYTLDRALNPFDDHDEFYWNVTGDEWDVSIASASATVTVQADDPQPIQRVTCFQGESGSTARCHTSEFDDNTATFASRGILFPGLGFTVVVGLDKGAVIVGAPDLVARPQNPWVKAFAVTPITVGLMLAGIVAAFVAVLRVWWVQGRDRWLGDMFYINETPSDPSADRIKPLMAHESIVVEFAPPEVDPETKRTLRPAEIGVLLDERADTLDVTATIVDLAVRKHLVIKEESSDGVFGLFKSKDYELQKLEPEVDDLLPYERELKDAFFESGETVKLSDLKNKFHDDLAKVKTTLYKQAMADKFFPYNPETIRNVVRVAGILVAFLGGLLGWGLGALFGGALLGIPVFVAGILLLLFANAFPRRTAAGRILYRRSLGFRRFMVESDKERQKFAEKANIFHEYLPFAIVYGCVDKWANAFKDLGIEVGQPGYYIGTGPFIATAFASNMSSFSSSIGSTMASTPGGSGGSGFSGGGGSGGGGGGGGGGSW